MAREAIIVDSVRTGLAKSHRGSFNQTRPDDMLAFCIDQLFERNPEVDRAEVADVIAGCGFPEGCQGMNVARVALLSAGLPASVPGTTVNRFCSSGSQAVAMAARHIQLDGAEVAIGSGVETITLMSDGSQNTTRMVSPTAAEKFPGLYMGMGSTVEIVADRYGISLEDQDAYA